MLVCPHCQESLIKNSTPHGFIWACTTCNGRAANINILKNQMPPQNYIKLLQDLTNGSGDLKNTCPSCTKKMIEEPILLQDEMLFIDICKPCNLIWFDDGEYESLQKVPIEKPAIKPLKLENAKTKLAIANNELYRMKSANEDYITQMPDNIWKMIPAILGLPVKEEYDDVVESNSKPWITWSLCVLILFISIMSFQHLSSVIMHYGLIPNQCFRNFGITLITAFFLHADYFHLLGNLYFLFVFSVNVEKFLGKTKFIGLVLSASLAGDLLHILFNFNSSTPCIGASGGISGVLIFFALKYPNAQIGMLLPIRFSSRWIRFPAYDFFGVWVILQAIGIYRQISGNSNISYLAHFGGIIAGITFWYLTREKNIKS